MEEPVELARPPQWGHPPALAPSTAPAPPSPLSLNLPLVKCSRFGRRIRPPPL